MVTVTVPDGAQSGDTLRVTVRLKDAHPEVYTVSVPEGLEPGMTFPVTRGTCAGGTHLPHDGWLFKRGERSGDRWLRRMFRLNEEGELKYFDSSHTDIKEVYTALLLYKHRQLRRGNNIKLKSIVLSGELGGRGIAYKPGGKKDPDGRDIIAAHSGYLTDQFYMFDAVKNRQITQHGEQALQNIGRLCGLTDDYFLNRMQNTPPRLWTSHSCYNVLKIFGLCVDQWVQVMQLKQADEAMKDAVVRCIKNDPERFAELYMVYFLPTSDPHWAKKQVWLRQSRLMRHDKIVGEHTRTAARMPTRIARARDFGIRHDPDADRTAAASKTTVLCPTCRAPVGDDVAESGAQVAAAPTFAMPAGGRAVARGGRGAGRGGRGGRGAGQP